MDGNPYKAPQTNSDGAGGAAFCLVLVGCTAAGMIRVMKR
jgi:hypothetical protein